MPGTPEVREHYRQVQRLEALAVKTGRRAISRLDPSRRNIRDQWSRQVDQMIPAVIALQGRAAWEGSSYIGLALAQTGNYLPPDGIVNPAAFTGYAPDGRSLSGLLESPVATRSGLLANPETFRAGILEATRSADRIMSTMIADIARQAATVDIIARHGASIDRAGRTGPRQSVGYVRVLNPPSCARCAMLAGKFYSYNAGFMRHPECDCAHQPCTKKASAAYVTDPYDYFRSLSPVEQDRLWGRYGAQAIRDGADMFSVGNAWRGMPRNARGAARLTTAEGVSPRKFGAYSGFFSRRYPGEQRLTPQGIYMTAKSPEEAIRLLRTHEYLVGPQDMHGVIGWADKGGTAKQIRRGDYVTTAAEERVDRARTKLESLLRKAQNPDTVTPPLETIARAETEYRRWLLSDGQIFTK